MIMLRALNSIPLWMLILGLLAVLELYSVGLMLLSRRKWGVERLKVNNEVAGFKFSVIGVLYAVLLAFVVITVWEHHSATNNAIRNEAKAVGDLTELSYALPVAQGDEVRALLKNYVEQVQQSEWTTMARGLPHRETAHALARLTRAIFTMQVEQLRDLAIFQQSLRLLTLIEDNRNERLDSANGSVPPILWLVLIGGRSRDARLPRIFRNNEFGSANFNDSNTGGACRSNSLARIAPRFPVHRRGSAIVTRIRGGITASPSPERACGPTQLSRRSSTAYRNARLVFRPAALRPSQQI
jgi:hypothetical protein